MRDRVNFLSRIQSGREFKARARQAILICSVVIATIIVCQYVFLRYQVGKQKQEITQLEVKLDDLNQLQFLHDTLEKKKRGLLSEKNMLNEMLGLQKRRNKSESAWSSVLRNLSLILPSGVWFNQLSVGLQPNEGAGTGFRVRLKGTAFSQEELMNFFSLMEEDPFWESATLQRIDRENNIQRDLPDLYRFEIILGLAI